RGASAHAREEVVDGAVRVGAAVEAAPGALDPADELVAGRDGDEPVLATTVAGGGDEQRLDVGLDGGRERQRARELLPRFEAERRLGGAGGAGVERRPARAVAGAEEEGEAHRDLQRRPGGVV